MIKRIKKLSRRQITTYLGIFVALVLLQQLVVQPYINRPRVPDLPEPTLKQLAKDRGIQLGNFAIANHLNQKPYTTILTEQFDLALADNTPNWYFTDGGLRPSATEYNFKQMDQVVDFARSNNMDVQAHHYLWGEQKWLPNWLKEGSYNKEKLNDLMRDHIMTVGKRYQGKVKEWTVVNEAFTRAQHLYDLRDWWADATGGQEYIDLAFKWAREADPDSTLILNDFNNESINDTSNAMYDYVKSAKARGIPIDGVGMQMHIDGTHPPTIDEVKSNMKRFADLGVKIYVTEFDVNMADVKAESDDRSEIQANIYYEMLRACIEVGSDVCPSFAYLGIYDGETWYNYIGLKDPQPLMFDRQYQPKPAYWAMRSALEQK